MANEVLMTQLPAKVKEFKELVSKLEADKANLRSNEVQAITGLREFLKYEDFDPAKVKTMLEAIKKEAVFHPDGATNQKLLMRICTDYYTKDKDVFVAFQKEMGGKQRRQQEMRQTQQQQSSQQQSAPQPKPKPRPQPTPQQQQTRQQPSNRIEYEDGYYEGEIRNGMPNGRGRRFFTSGESNGNRQEGIFRDGCLDDKNGMEYYRQQQRTDRGEYEGGDRIGSGRMEWQDGSWYEGEWSNYGPSGYGKMYYADMKRTDEGMYVKGVRKGTGVMRWKSGDRYEGTWDETSGSLNGKGIYYYADGRREQCKWVNGKYKAAGMIFDGPQLGKVGKWLWDALPYAPFVIAAIVTVVKLFTDGFWSALWTAIIGGIAAYIVFWILLFIMGTLEVIRDWFIGWPKLLKVTFWIILAAFIAKTIFTKVNDGIADRKAKSEVVAIINDLKGKWTGTFNGKAAVLEINQIRETSTEIIIRIGTTEKRMLSSEFDKLPALNLRPAEKGGDYPGTWEGTVNGNTYSGTYTNPNTGATLPFEFKTEDAKEDETSTTEASSPAKNKVVPAATSAKEDKTSTTEASSPTKNEVVPVATSAKEDETSTTETSLPAKNEVVPAAPSAKVFEMNPRPRMKQGRNNKALYIDRVMIEGNKFYVFFTGAAKGDGGDGNYGPFWKSIGSVVLTNLDDSKTWIPKDKGEDESFTKVTTGFYLVFEGVSGSRFSLKGTSNYFFEEIVLK